MPTYEYKCEACGNQFEKFHSITAKAIRKCPKCGKNKVRRLVGTGAGMIFKGSGFYITDYRSEGYKNAAKAEAPTSPGDKKSTETKTPASAESKPAAPKPAEPSKHAKK